jgi:putative transposase
MRDVEALCEEAGLGQVSASSVSRICSELKDRYRAFRERELSQVDLVALFLDAIYLPVRPIGRKEGVLCAWGIDRDGKRVLIDVCLGMASRRRTGPRSAAASSAAACAAR